MTMRLFSSVSIFAMMLLTGCGSSGTDETASPGDSGSMLPKDEPYYKYAWHISSSNSTLNTLGYSIDEDADINMAMVWEVTKGAGVKVAVIDDAFDVEHEDLKARIVATYNADDDSDDVSNHIPLGSTDEEGYPDDGSHGNTCAGFIVAPVNGKGTVGIAPESDLIAISLRSNFDSDTIKAFEYAKAQGAKVISCSWGTEDVSEAVVSELKSLYDAGITVLFASGNDGKSLDAPGIDDESEVAWVIGVGASGENNDVTSYSNYGENIDILAPGGDVQDSIGILGIDDTGVRGDQNQQGLVSDAYAFTNGTSFATPVAAGVVSLLYSIHPSITPSEIREVLISTAKKIGGESASYDSEGFDERRAYGKIDAGDAVTEVKSASN